MGIPDFRSLASEFVYTSSRSAGPGGQNVNKVNSKVTLRFDVHASKILDEEQKARILHSLSAHINKEGVLILHADRSRSQLSNKEAVTEKFQGLLVRTFRTRKKRKPTKPTKASKQKRLDSKKRRSEKKQWRRGI